MNATLLFVLLLVFLGSTVNAQNFGTDLSTYTLPTSFACLKNNGYYYTIVRAWKKDGTPDTSCPATVANAWAGGMTNVDVYMFPCVSCGNPGQQVRDAVAYLASYNTTYTTFWLDVEGLDLWSTNLTANQEFLQGMINAGEQLGLKLGIYASKTMWTGIMGVNYPGGSQYPLWYPRYNNLTNYDDFVPFGGWTTPVMKQYLGTTAICGASVDFNWFPPSPSPSATPSTSVTPSRSPSRSPSSTPSTSPSSTPSRSPSRTPTPSRSPSRSPSPTRSPSRTPSPSASVTPTASASALPQPTFEPGVVSPFPIPSPQCQQCSGDGDCSGGQGICVTSPIGSYCACLSGFGGCECSESPAPQCSGSYSAVDTMSGNFQANATVDYQYPNLLITVEANLEESSWGNGDSDPSNPPPYSLETIIYFGSSPEAYPECSYPNGEATWQDQATDASCTDVWLSTMSWAFAKERCGFAAINGSRNYTQTITVLRRYNLNDVITRTEKTTRHLNVNFPEEVVIVDSNVTVNFPSANAFAGISSVDYDPATSLWTVIVQTSVNKPYALTFPVAALYSGNLEQRAPTVSVSGCTSVGSACVQTITYTYPQGGASDPCVGLFGTDRHTFALQCSTAACPAPNLLNITTTLNTGNACPIVDEIEFSEASLHSYSNAAVTNAKDTFSVIDVMYFGASVQSTEAMISSRTLKANSVCFLPPSGTCFYPEYTLLSASNGKDPVFSVDFTAPGNAAYFGSITTPTAFQVKATVVVNFEGAKSLRRKKSVPQTQTVDTITTALIGGSTSDSNYTAPSLLLLILVALLI